MKNTHKRTAFKKSLNSPFHQSRSIMELKSVAFKNFKCFKRQQEIDLKKLTILTGANSSGKSSVLYTLLGAFQSNDFPFLFTTNGMYVDMGDFRNVVYRNLEREEIELSYTFYDPTHSVTHKLNTGWKCNKLTKLPELNKLDYQTGFIDLKINKEGNLYNIDFKYDVTIDPTVRPKYKEDLLEYFINMEKFNDKIHADSGTKRNKPKVAPDEYLNSIFSNQDLTIVVKDFNDLNKKKGTEKLRIIFRELNDIFIGYENNINYISSHRLHPERTYLEKSVDELKVDISGHGYLDQIIVWENQNPKKIKELISILSKLGVLFDIKTKRIGGGRYETQVATKPNNIKVSISDVGFGVNQFLPIIVADLQLEANSTLFISQPEIHLNPSVQSLFGEYLCKQVVDKKKQKNYIVETHSEYLLNRIRLAIVKEEIDPNQIAIYHIENKDKDAIVHRITLGKKGEIIGAPEDFFKTYMMDVMEIALNS